MTAAIIIDQLRKVYPRTWNSPSHEALKDVSLTVQEGEVFGFVGPNGAGKSTTIKILTGSTRATSGKILLFGTDSSEPKSRKNLGYVPENPSLPDYLTPIELLRMKLEVTGVSIPNPQKHCLQWLDRFGLSHAANKLMRGFSKGMLQRTALAHGLISRPKLLVLDEPLSGLDPIGRRDVVDILAEFKNQGGSIFLTSHVLHDVERLADRFGLIHQGSLKTISSPTELLLEDKTLIVRSVGETNIPGLTRETDNRWIGYCQRKDIWELLHQMEQAGHQIVEIKPQLNLEAMFVQYVEGR